MNTLPWISDERLIKPVFPVRQLPWSGEYQASVANARVAVHPEEWAVILVRLDNECTVKQGLDGCLHD